MKTRKWLALLLAAVMVLSVTGAFAAKNPKINADDLNFEAIIDDTEAEGTVNVYHWWTAGGEKDAIESVVATFGEIYENIEAKSNAIPGGAGGAMVMKVKVLQQTGKSPEAFQAHPGQEIQPYLSSDLLLNLDGVWEDGEIEDRLIPSLVEMCTSADGNHYVVPIGIHKTNIILYNIHVFEKYGVEIPDHEDITWDEFWAICDELAAKMPEGEYPLDLGDQKGWPAGQVFENILLGTDPQLYEDFINDNYNVEDLTRVMETYTKLMDYVAPDHNSRDWYHTTGSMVTGTYAMQIMGAWAQPLMTNMDQVYGVDYGVFTFPGTEGWFGLCVDGFVVSNNSANVEGGVRWAYSVCTQDVQEYFSSLKESISPYTDTPDDVYNELTLHFKEQLMDENTKIYPSITHGTAIPWSASTSLQTQIQEYATSTNHDAEYYANRIVNILKEANVKGDWNLVD